MSIPTGPTESRIIPKECQPPPQPKAGAGEAKKREESKRRQCRSAWSWGLPRRMEAGTRAEKRSIGRAGRNPSHEGVVGSGREYTRGGESRARDRCPNV